MQNRLFYALAAGTLFLAVMLPLLYYPAVG